MNTRIQNSLLILVADTVTGRSDALQCIVFNKNTLRKTLSLGKQSSLQKNQIFEASVHYDIFPKVAKVAKGLVL
jgi:hypothetical protein